MRAVKSKVIYAFSSTPLLWVGWFYLYVLRQRMLLGYWPSPYRPDPKDAGYFIHHLSIYAGLLLVPVLGLVTIAMIFHRKIQDASFKWWLAIGLLGLSYFCFQFVLHFDPGRYWEWFID